MPGWEVDGQGRVDALVQACGEVRDYVERADVARGALRQDGVWRAWAAVVSNGVCVDCGCSRNPGRSRPHSIVAHRPPAVLRTRKERTRKERRWKI